MKTKQILSIIVLIVTCFTQKAWADNAAGIANYVNTATYGDLVATSSGSTVTVTGTLIGAPSTDHYLTLNIDAGVTVVWQAALSGSPSGSYALINISGGAGTFSMESGSIENIGTGSAIRNSSSCAIIVSGGTVNAVNSYAIANNSTATISVSGNATVNASGGTSIYNADTGTVKISGGVVSSKGGGSNSTIRSNSSGVVIVSGGTVSATANNYCGNAIYIGMGGSLMVSGGTVSATCGHAITTNSAATITVSGNASITSTSSGSGGTIYIGGTLHINGGTVENTGNGHAIQLASTSSIVNVNGGTVKAASGNAIDLYIYPGLVNISGGTVTSGGNAINTPSYTGGNVIISGGTVSTSGNGKAAIYNGKVTVTGGTLSANNGYAIYGESNATQILGGNPTITGRIYSFPEKLSVLTTGDNAFVPSRKIYTLDFPAAQYVTSKIAVMNGRNFLENFVLYNSDWALVTSSAHLAIASAVKVSFDLNGGTGTPPATIGVEQGNKLYNKPSAADFTKTGYANDGNWYTSSDCTTEFVFGDNGTSVVQNMTLYLKWTPITYTITYDLDDGVVSLANPTSYTIETNTFTLHNPTKANCAFTGWTGSNGVTPQITTTVEQGSIGDKNYTANWALSVKSVSVGIQNGVLTAGIAGMVTFPISTTNIANGNYTTTITDPPIGMSVQGQVEINNNSGTLSISTTVNVAAKTYPLTLTIDETTSDAFMLTVSEKSIPPSPVPIFSGLADSYNVGTTAVPLIVTGIGSEQLTVSKVNGTIATMFDPSNTGTYLVEAASTDGKLKIWKYVTVTNAQ